MLIADCSPHLTCMPFASYGLKDPGKGDSMRRSMLMASILIVFSAALSAQTVDEIIAKSIAASGGLEKIKAVTTSRRTGTFEGGPIQAGFVELTKRPNKLRREIG